MTNFFLISSHLFMNLHWIKFLLPPFLSSLISFDLLQHLPEQTLPTFSLKLILDILSLFVLTFAHLWLERKYFSLRFNRRMVWIRKNALGLQALARWFKWSIKPHQNSGDQGTVKALKKLCIYVITKIMVWGRWLWFSLQVLGESRIIISK